MNQRSNSLFPSSNQQSNSLFPSNNQQNSLFSSNNQQSGSLFPTNNQQQNSLFSTNNQQSGSLFPSNNQQSGSLFPSNNQQSGSLFPTNNQQQNSLFPTNNQPTNSLFPSNNQQQTSLFPSNNQLSNSLFPTNNQRTNTLFPNNNQQSNSLFPSNNQPLNSLFPSNNQRTNSLFPSNQPIVGQNQNQNQFNDPFSSLNSSSTLKDFVKLLNGNDQVLCYYLNNSKEIDKAINIIKSYDGKELDELEDNLNKLYANLANLDYILNKESIEVNEIHKQLLDDKINTQLMNPDSYLREMTPFKEINPIFLNNYKEFEKVQKYCKETIIYLEQAFNSQPIIKSQQTIPTILKTQYQCLLDISSRVSKCHTNLNDKKLKLLK